MTNERRPLDEVLQGGMPAAPTFGEQVLLGPRHNRAWSPAPFRLAIDLDLSAAGRGQAGQTNASPGRE